MSGAACSRREALRRGAIGAGAIAAAGLLRPALAGAQSPDDEDLRDFLIEAITLEQLTVFAYVTAADSNEIDGALKSALERLRDQEQAHASALRSALDSLGFDAPDAPDSTADSAVFEDVEGLSDESSGELTTLLDDLDGLKAEDELLEFLAELERRQLDFYLAESPGLDSEDLSTTGAEIAGCQAQHLVVLGEQLGTAPADSVAELGDTTAAATGE